MRLRMRDHVYVAPVADGAFALTPRGPVRFSGSSVHQWIERLAPHLDGTRTLAELTSGMTEQRRALVEQLARAMLDGELAVRVDEPAGSLPSERPRCLLAGSGALHEAAARVLAHAGLDVRGGTDHGRIPDTVDAVVYVGDRPDAELIRVLAGQCAALGIPLTCMAAAGDAVWLLPPAIPVAGRNVWAAAWWRVEPPGEWPPKPFASGDEAPPSGAVLTVAAARLGSALSGFLAGSRDRDPGPPSLIRIDPVTLGSTTHPYVPHPFAVPAAPGTPEELLESVARWRAAPALTEEEFSQRAVAGVDPLTGLLSGVSEGSLPQLPLCVAQATVRDPCGLLGGTPLVVTGTGRDFTAARLDAARRGFAAYAALTFDPRRTRDGNVLGYDMGDGSAYPLAAALAFPALSARSGRLRPPAGVASGLSLRQALEEGLTGSCREFTVERSLASTKAFPRVAVEDVPAAADTYRRTLEMIGEPWWVHDITDATGIPGYVFGTGDRTVAYTSSLVPDHALTDGLTQLLLDHQARTNSSPQCAPDPVPPFPRGLRATGRTAFVRPAISLRAAVANLRRLGLRAVAVPLDHDLEADLLMPHPMHVVLIHA
ncbi:hypothetical protein [Streptomyces sp. NPDC001568]|uniref:hypothetical protein n=1 Tax=Streptomyces sp. NPDC001568 TaxID=3364588 RepID=UPI0036AF4C56